MAEAKAKPFILTNCKWAVNKAKLTQAFEAVRKSGAEVTEEAVKENYIARKGLLVEEQEVLKKTVRPRVTTNVK